MDIALGERPPVVSNSVMADVEQTYLGRSSDERLLVIVFDSAAATVQITGPRQTSLAGVTAIARVNAVVLYQHEDGTVNRANVIRSALARVPTQG